MRKPPLNMFPFTTAYPPYTTSKQWVMTFLQNMRDMGKYNPVRVFMQAPYTYGPLAKL